MLRNFLRHFAVLMLSMLAINAFSQVTTSAISGSVKGAKNAILEGATVRALHTPTGTIYSTQTRKGGRFDIVNMETGGPYTITISYVGYEPLEVKDIILTLGNTENLNIVLTEVGSELQQVVVAASANRGQRSLKSGASSNYGERVILGLPNISRSITNITTLTPQAGGGNSIGGRDGRYNNIQIDGANFNNNFGLSSNPLPGGASAPISIDALEEISVNISPYDVKQSNFTGAGINATTRRGTNKFSGSAYTFYRNEGFLGRKAVGKDVGAVTPSTAQTFGGRIGGPIIKNKLFFFVNGEYDKRDAPGLVWEATRSGVPAGPNTSRTTSTDLDLVSSTLQSRYGYNTGPYEKLGNFNTESKRILARLDWNISKEHTFSLRYNWMEGTDDQLTNGTSAPNPRASSNRWSRNSMSYESSLYNFTNKVSSLSAELKSRFSNNLSNQLLATFTKISDLRGSTSSPFPFVDIWKDGDSYISFGYELFSYKNQVENKVFIITDNLSYNVGNHSFTAGISYENQEVLNGFLRYGTSYYRFASVDDFINNAAPTAFGLTYPYAGQNPYADLRFGQVAAYLQDEFKVNDRFKLTYGVRFDKPLFLNELTNNPGIQALNFRDLEGQQLNIDVSKWPKSRIIVSPRIGFNWDVDGDKNLIIRGGAGIFTGRFPFVWFTNQPTNAGIIQNTVELSNTNSAQATILSGMRFDPDPNKWLSLFPQQPGGTPPNSIAAVDQDFKMPMVFRTSIGVDKKLSNDWTLTLEG
ncbi:MAG: TonB-dependent receptor, partial [Chitinophagaceae bacterium]|nr:TonB-dependent receptor [Chitinophagaceae bacterium]